MSKVYITTPIYYVNGAPHIGHAHTTVMADILKRSRLMMGMEAFLTTGTDEHGQKNQEAAEKSGLDCQVYLAQKSGEFKNVFDHLGISYDMFVRTTRATHMKQVAHIEQTLFDQGLIVKKKYSGQYCTGCEQFKKESDLTPEGRCPDHSNIELEQTDEVNYFLQIEPYRAWLLDYVEKNPNWLQPSRYRTELLGMLKEPLEDLCISRPKTRVSLGVQLPFDLDYVTYVWFDALINYITNVGWPEEKFNDWWPHSMHLIGKDIVKTHCIYWPIMLHALNIQPPNQVVVHGYWVGPGGQKMSKTLGNVVDPIEVMETFGADGLRFYLAKHMRGSVDSQISMELVLQTYTSDLANNIGNLLARVSKFANSRFDGVIPSPENYHPDDQKLVQGIAATITKACCRYEMTDIPDVLNTIVGEARVLNEYVADKAPWTMIKDEDARDRVASILYAALDGLRLVFEGLYPFVPETANKGLAVLGCDAMSQVAHMHVFQAGDLKPGSDFGEMANLFPRIQLDK